MILALLATLASAGLGPDDVIVLYNGDDAASETTAAYYADARDIADDHLCPVSGIDPATTEIDFATFDAAIREPFEACRDALSSPDDIDAIVIVRGLPYRVTLPEYVASLSATLQVGRAVRVRDEAEAAGLAQLKDGNYLGSQQNPTYLFGEDYPGDTTASYGPSSLYMTSPRIVRGVVRGPFERVTGEERIVADLTRTDFDYTDELYIVSRLDGFDHGDARDVVDRSVDADGSFPEADFLCMHGADGARGVRDAECEHALRMIEAAGGNTEWVDTFDGELSGREVIAYWTGAANLRGAIDGVTYAPGAVADNLTSFGAVPRNFFCDETGELCPENESQTSMARFIRAGASATQGTVAEPLNAFFPNAGFLILYERGYTLGEAWLYNLRFLRWVNTTIGDPLMAPFAERPLVTVPDEVPANEPLSPGATHPDGVARLAVWVDGVKVFDDADPGLPGLVPEAWGAVEGDTVEVLAVATSAAPPGLSVAGWPAAAPVAFDPATKGWSRASVTIGAPLPEPDLQPEPGGCASLAVPPATWWGLPLVLLGLLPRRRNRVLHA